MHDDSEVRAATKAAKEELDRVRADYEAKIAEMKVGAGADSPIVVVAWCSPRVVPVCVQRVDSDIWQSERLELLAANGRLHEERMELRSLLDDERARSAGMESMKDVFRPEVNRMRSELANAAEELESLKRAHSRALADVSRLTTANKDVEANCASRVRVAENESMRLQSALSVVQQVRRGRRAVCATRCAA